MRVPVGRYLAGAGPWISLEQALGIEVVLAEAVEDASLSNEARKHVEAARVRGYVATNGRWWYATPKGMRAYEGARDRLGVFPVSSELRARRER